MILYYVTESLLCILFYILPLYQIFSTNTFYISEENVLSSLFIFNFDKSFFLRQLTSLLGEFFLWICFYIVLLDYFKMLKFIPFYMHFYEFF